MDEQNAMPEPVDPAMEDLDATAEDADSVIGGEDLSQSQQAYSLAQSTTQAKAKAAHKGSAALDAFNAS